MQYSLLSDQPELDCLEQEAILKVYFSTLTFSGITPSLQPFQEPRMLTGEFEAGVKAWLSHSLT